MKVSVLLVCLLLMFFDSICHTYDSLPMVGSKIPDFRLMNIKKYGKKNEVRDGFKGRWLILDFWTSNCKACIASFSKIDKFQRDFRDQVQFVMIGKNDTKYNRGIEKLFERISSNKNLELAAVFDSVLIEKWRIGSVPHIYIIDPDGIVRFITDGRDMTADKLRSMFLGGAVSFYDKEVFRVRVNFDPDHIDTTANILRRSVLTEWRNETQNGGYPIDLYAHTPSEWKKGWSVSMVPLYALYNYAYLGVWSWMPMDTLYYGKFATQPILELIDTSLFQYDFHEMVGKGTYNYSLKVSPKYISVDYIKSEIQDDLRSVFGYDVKIEAREFSVWNLVSVSPVVKNLNTKHAKSDRVVLDEKSYVNATGVSLLNVSIDTFLMLISQYMKDYNDVPYLNATGNNAFIDISISADMTNIVDLNKALEHKGLKLIKGKKLMKVLVIRDRLE